jgi:hypothetical protein
MTAVKTVALVILVAASSADAEVLHEKVTVGALKCTSGVCVSPARPGVPVAVAHNGEILAQPADGPEPRPGEPIYTPQPDRVEVAGGRNPPVNGDLPPERRDAIRPDRETGPEGPGKHFYHEVFNPAVFPFKRMTALDGVELADGEERLVVRDRTLNQLEVDERHGPLRDAFWGSIVVDLEPGKFVPIPSASADAAILSYTTEPAVALTFARDSADNIFVRSQAGGRHRLIWLSDGPQRYFGGEVPRSVELADEPPQLVPRVPEATRRRVREFLLRAHLFVDPHAPLVRTLDPLVAWFRAFETGELAARSGNTYFDLATAQKGVCRHRSYAFAITAMAIGIPTRYVENELHVFVEVYVPRLGWRRINLGGATLDEQVLDTDDKTPYQPRAGDPFPQPPAYAKGAQPPAPAMQGSTRHSDGNGGSGGGRSHALTLQYVDLDALDREAPAPRISRSATQITVEASARSTFRGEAVEVTGAVLSGGGAGALPVEIYLQGPGGAVRVGETTTAADGRFRARIEVPRNLPLGDHRVVARTPGDDRRAPSRSR